MGMQLLPDSKGKKGRGQRSQEYHSSIIDENCNYCRIGGMGSIDFAFVFFLFLFLLLLGGRGSLHSLHSVLAQEDNIVEGDLLVAHGTGLLDFRVLHHFFHGAVVAIELAVFALGQILSDYMSSIL